MSYPIDPLTTPTEYSSGANTTLSRVPDVPPGYAGTSIRALISGLPADSPFANVFNGGEPVAVQVARSFSPRGAS